MIHPCLFFYVFNELREQKREEANKYTRAQNRCQMIGLMAEHTFRLSNRFTTDFVFLLVFDSPE